ncbi:NAD(P)/FAD-dependent oxidoreductase [Microbacterium gorillae]|uniref:NAD(P)/FAD-dependent oxidoreductase n=1 Tax=Microbacterium gorillae TaxID=1231063 RepID=UPI00058B6790|nr:FAD-dependent oxidoreductase [Microbacterium gorillae]
MTIVIAGGGLSALRSAEDLRRRGYADRIVVIGAEQEPPYNRPPLSKELLWGGATAADLAFGVSEGSDDIEWLLGRSVAAADLTARNVVLDDGEMIGFDGLVAATGVTSRRLDIPGPTRGRIGLRTLAEAESVRAALVPGARIVCLGAGFIGCEVARTARALGCEVDVVALDPVPLAIPLGPVAGAELRRRHEAAGIRFHLGRTVAETVGDECIEGVVLSDGTRLPADLLLETVGSVPNTSWLHGNGADLQNGVLTDEWLRVDGRPGIVAVGDVARFANPLFDAPALRIEHWQTAIDTAAFATATLMHDLGLSTDAPAPVSIMPWFWSDQGDLRLTSYGMLGLADETEIVEGELDGECAIAYRRDGEVVGYLLIGMKQKGARYKRQLGKERAALRAAAV